MNTRHIIFWIVAIIIILVVARALPKDEATRTSVSTTTASSADLSPIEVIPVTHATVILKWAGATLYADPTGTSTLFDTHNNPDIIFVTDVHGDHMSTSTLSRVIGGAILIVPQAVKELLPISLLSHVVVLKNGETTKQSGFTITAVPMYNLPVTTDSRHTKGRGNGYVIEKNGTRIYIAGDTSGTPEMRALKDIDIAFIPMNLPFTMGIEEAAEAVLAFSPKQVYPYHYRGQNGLSDTEAFKALVNKGSKNIEVILKNWYQTR